MQSKKKIIISSVLIGLLAIVVLLSNKGGSNNLTSNAVSKISTEFALPDPEETKKRISELNKEIQAMVIGELNATQDDISSEKMQDISTRFEILNNKKVQLKNEEGIERAREQISNLSSQEKSLSDRSKQLSDSMNVLLKKDKTLQQQANEIFVKKSKASNAKEIREFTSREKEINQKIKQTQAEYKKLRDESIQISIQIAQVKSSYKKTNQDIQATEKAIRTISEDFFLHMSMAVESFKTGKDNEKCEQYTYLGSILPQVDTTVLDSSLQYGETRLKSFMKKPLPATQLAEAKSLYSEMQPVLLNLKNSITAYDTQRADYMKKIAYELSKVPSYCLQLDKKIKADRELLPKNDAVYSSWRKQVIVLERFITWMDQNHFTGNN